MGTSCCYTKEKIEEMREGDSQEFNFEKSTLFNTKLEDDNQKVLFNNNRNNNNIYGASSNKSFANNETKIEKVNPINFMNKKLRNIDNNGEEEELVNINNDKKLFEEFSKIKETITIASKKLEKLKKLISNCKEPILVGLNNIGANC